MWMLLLTCHVATFCFTHARNDCPFTSSFRTPENSDIIVHCGTDRIDLEILVCPIYFNGYNESVVALNGQHSKPECHGTVDWSEKNPTVKFNFSITEGGVSKCLNTMTITQEAGTGVFSEFSVVEFVNISGMVCSTDAGPEHISYVTELMYKFSCRYPLQYLINNTEMSVAGVNLAIRDNNGSFDSTLSMKLFWDSDYTREMFIPPKGLELKTRIFAEVRASNLSNRFNVLLDRCYCTASRLLVDSVYHDLIVGCKQDTQTEIDNNGDRQVARFSFEAFRFVFDGEGHMLSTYYLHCITKLCVSTACNKILKNCDFQRKRRSVENEGTTVSDPATVSSGPISIREDLDQTQSYIVASQGYQHSQDTVVVVSVIAGLIGAICLSLVAFVVYQNHNSRKLLNNRILYPQE